MMIYAGRHIDTMGCGGPRKGMVVSMFCVKCGNQVSDTAKFCAKCGAAMENMMPDGETGSAVTSAVPVPEAKKNILKKIFNKKNTVPLGVAAGVLVAGIAVSANWKPINNLLHKTFSSDKKYYQFVEKQAIEELASSAGAVYDSYILNALNIYDRSVSGSVTIELTEEGQDLLELAGLAGADLSWLKSATLNVNSNVKNHMLSFGAGLQLNRDSVISGNFLMDIGGEELYFQIPELTKTCLGMDLSEYLSSYDRRMLEEFTDRQELYRELAAALPGRSQTEKLLRKYLESAAECVDDLSVGTKTLKVEGVQQKCTELKAVIDADTLEDIRTAVLEELLTDKEIRKIIIDVTDAMGAGLDGEEAYEEFLEEVEDALDHAGDIDEDFRAVMRVYVDGRGEIKGRSIEWENDYFGTKDSVSVLMAESGNKFGYEMTVTDSGDTVKLSGSGRTSGSRITGDFTVSYNGTPVVEFTASGLDTKKLKKGQLEGTFEVELSSAAASLDGYRYGYGYYRTALSALEDTTFTLTVKSSDKSGEIKIGVNYDGDDLGSITVSAESGSGSKVSLPGGKDVIMAEDSEDFLEWLKSADWDRLLSDLDKTDLPNSVLDMIEEIGEELEDADEEDLYRLYRSLYYLF